MKNKSTIIVEPQGFLDSENTQYLLQEYKISKTCKNLFVSFEKIISFNKPGINNLLLQLKDIQQEINCNVGLINCDDNNIKKIFTMSLNNMDDIAIFDNKKVLNLFVENEQNNNQKIYIYKNEQSSSIMMELKSRNYNAQIIDENKEIEEDSICIKKSYIKEYKHIVPTFNKIDNSIVYHFSGFINSEIRNFFDIEFHNNLIRVGFRVFIIDVNSVSVINIDGIKFLLSIQKINKQNGAIFAILGLKNSSVVQKLRDVLIKSDIIIVDSLDDIKQDNILQKDLRNSLKKLNENTPVEKIAITQLNSIINPILDTIKSFSNIEYKRESIKAIKNIAFNIFDESIAIILGQYGDYSATITIIMSKNLAESLILFLMNEDESLVTLLEDIFSSISTKIESNLKKNKINISTTPPRIIEDITDLAVFLKNKKSIEIYFKFLEEDLKIYIS